MHSPNLHTPAHSVCTHHAHTACTHITLRMPMCTRNMSTQSVQEICTHSMHTCIRKRDTRYLYTRCGPTHVHSMCPCKVNTHKVDTHQAHTHTLSSHVQSPAHSAGAQGECTAYLPHGWLHPPTLMHTARTHEDPLHWAETGPSKKNSGNTPTCPTATHTSSTQDERCMRANHVHEVCQERRPTLHTHSCAHAPAVHTQHPSTPPGCPEGAERGREARAAPLSPQGQAKAWRVIHRRDRLGPGEFLTQLLRR